MRVPVTTPAAVTLRVLCAPKDGNSPEQYEDASSHTPLAADTDTFTVALSDGASSAIFARQWASLLVKAWSSEPFPDTDEAFGARVAALGRSWRQEVEGKATSWHAQEKMTGGSSATLLVVTWYRAELRWEARAVGDVCLFLVRENRLRYAFPVTKSARFGNRPDLLSTEIGSGAVLPKVPRFGTAYEPGDRFLLMTDALAAWFLTQWEAKRKPWNDLPDSDAALGPWLKTQRDSGALKNDDVTLLDLTL